MPENSGVAVSVAVSVPGCPSSPPRAFPTPQWAGRCNSGSQPPRWQQALPLGSRHALFHSWRDRSGPGPHSLKAADLSLCLTAKTRLLLRVWAASQCRQKSKEPWSKEWQGSNDFSMNKDEKGTRTIDLLWSCNYSWIFIFLYLLFLEETIVPFI